MSQECTGQIDEENKEFQRLLLETSQAYAANQTHIGADQSKRATVDERDAFLKGLHRIITMYEKSIALS